MKKTFLPVRFACALLIAVILSGGLSSCGGAGDVNDTAVSTAADPGTAGGETSGTPETEAPLSEDALSAAGLLRSGDISGAAALLLGSGEPEAALLSDTIGRALEDGERAQICEKIISELSGREYLPLIEYAHEQLGDGKTLAARELELGHRALVYAVMDADESFTATLAEGAAEKADYAASAPYYAAVAGMLYSDYGAVIQRSTGLRRNEMRDRLLSMLAALPADTAEASGFELAAAVGMSDGDAEGFAKLAAAISAGAYDDPDEPKDALDRLFVYSMTPNDPSGTPSDFTGTALTQVWSDEFDGDTLDTDSWNYGECGPQTAFGDIGDPDEYRAEHIYLENGDLVLKVEYMDNSVLNPSSPDYAGDQNVSNVWVDNKGKFAQTYGYYEMRCKLGNGAGSNCAFWMAAGNPWSSSSLSSRDGAEIDVFESIAGWVDKWGNNKKLESTVHWQHGTASKNKTFTYFYNSKGSTRENTKIPVDFFDEQYHTFGVLWTKEEYAFFYDGYEVYRTDCTENGGAGVCEEDAYLLISNHFMDPDWYGQSTPEGYPYEFRVDYVRSYQLDEYLR